MAYKVIFSTGSPIRKPKYEVKGEIFCDTKEEARRVNREWYNKALNYCALHPSMDTVPYSKIEEVDSKGTSEYTMETFEAKSKEGLLYPDFFNTETSKKEDSPQVEVPETTEPDTSGSSDNSETTPDNSESNSVELDYSETTKKQFEQKYVDLVGQQPDSSWKKIDLYNALIDAYRQNGIEVVEL